MQHKPISLVILLLKMFEDGNQSEAAHHENVPERSDAVQHRSRTVFDELCVAKQFLQRIKQNVLMHVLLLGAFENLDEVDQVLGNVQH
jgi:hypothetical protein